MFDFLLSEEWWVNEIIEACINAVAVIIVGILTADVLYRKKFEKLSDEHGKLAEHNKKLASQHGRIIRETEVIEENLKNVDKSVDLLIAHMHKEEGRNDKVSSSLESPDYVLKAINAVYDKNVELNHMVSELKEQNKEQSMELKACREEIASLKAELSKHRARTADRDVPSL